MGKYVNVFNKRLKAADNARYTREQYQSFMTGPEWFSVEISETFAKFLGEKKSMFQFPFFSQIAELWKVFYQSYSAARKYQSAYEILTSDYMIMDLFVVIFTSTELFLKGMVSVLLYPFLSKNNDTTMQKNLADYFAFYAKDIEDKPFFQHDWVRHRNELAQKYKQCDDRTWTDWFTWTCVSIEMAAKIGISYCLNSGFVEEPSTTDVLVKFNAENEDDPEQAKAMFKLKLAEIDERLEIKIVDEQVYAKNKNTSKTYTSVYARLAAPRYMEFRKAVHALADKNIHIRKIAGQDHVQVKCDLTALDEDQLRSRSTVLCQTEHATLLYTYRDGVHSNRQMCMFDVPVSNLDKTLDQLETKDGTTIPFIHNF